MARAAGFGDDIKGFFKAVEAGSVKSKDVLPKFAEEMKKMAREGGALGAVMGKTRAEMARFLNTLDESKDTIFQNGMDDGLGYMFGQLSDLLQEMQPVAKAIGNTFKGAVMGITAAVKTLTIPMRAVVGFFSSMFTSLEMLGVKDPSGMLWTLVGAGGVLALMVSKFGFVAKAIWSVNAALLTMAARFAPIIAAYMVIEDIALYAKYGDKVDTMIGRSKKYLEKDNTQSKILSPFGNDGKYYLNPVIAGGVNAYDTIVKFFFDDNEASKMIKYEVTKQARTGTATTQTEVTQ